MITYQVTIFDINGKYKPVSTLVKKQEPVNLKDLSECKKLYIEGATKICQQRLWKSSDLLGAGYKRYKIRVYDKAKIEAENKARYEKIKEEKYASGEWTRPGVKKFGDRG